VKAATVESLGLRQCSSRHSDIDSALPLQDSLRMDDEEDIRGVQRRSLGLAVAASMIGVLAIAAAIFLIYELLASGN
jgi:hypothetical protein